MRAGGVVGGDTFTSKERFCDFSGFSFAYSIPLPIYTKDIPLRSPSTRECYPIRLHFRHGLVGNRTQHDRIFCRGSCKFLDEMFYCLVYVNLLFHCGLKFH